MTELEQEITLIGDSGDPQITIWVSNDDYLHFRRDPVYADIMYKEALREYKKQPQKQAPKGPSSALCTKRNSPVVDDGLELSKSTKKNTDENEDTTCSSSVLPVMSLPTESSSECTAVSDSKDENEELPKLSTRWTRQATLCLLKAYRDLEWKLSDPKIKNKAVWQKIAKCLSEHDFMFNAKKCERKMLNMKRDYRSVIDHNNKTGNDRKTHPYLDEMSELFGLKPTAKPVAVSSSMVTKPNGEKPKEGTEIENKKEKESRKRKISNIETFADMLKTMSAKSDERLEILQYATRATGYTKFIPHLHEI